MWHGKEVEANKHHHLQTHSQVKVGTKWDNGSVGNATWFSEWNNISDTCGFHRLKTKEMEVIKIWFSEYFSYKVDNHAIISEGKRSSI